MLELNPVTDSHSLRTAYSTFPSGVIAVCALQDGQPVGIAASSFTTVSMDPPLVSVCVQHTSATWPKLATSARLGLSILGSEQGAACRQIAAKTEDRFASLDWDATPEGALLLHGAAAWLDCSIYASVPAGDHDLILLRIHNLQVHNGIGPLIFHASSFKQLAAA